RAEEVLAVGALQAVGLARLREVREGAVDRREPDARLVSDEGVEVLRAHESVAVGERLAHPLALPRVALCHASEFSALPRGCGGRPRPGRGARRRCGTRGRWRTRWS